MKFSLSFLLVIVLVVAVVFAWLRWSREELQVHDAVTSGNAAAVARWAKRRPKLLTDNKYYPPSALLRSAVETHNVEVLETITPLVMAKTPSKDVYNALVMAVQQGHTDSIRVLLENGLDPNANADFSMLVDAQKRGQAEIVELLLTHKADPTSALAWACEHDTDFAFRMLSLGAEADVNGALSAAVRSGKFELMSALLENGANSAKGLIGINEETPKAIIEQLVTDADFKIDWRLIRELTKSLFAHSDSSILERVFPQLTLDKSHNPLFQLIEDSATVRKPLEKLEVLLNNDVEIAPSLFYELVASKSLVPAAKVPMFHRLFEEAQRRDPDFNFSDAQHPFYACISRFGSNTPSTRIEIAKTLIDAGYTEKSDVDGASFLHAIAWDKDETNLRIAEALIKHGLDVNSRDDRKRTPLHRAVNASNIEMLRLFLNAGADASLKDDDERTPLDLARKVESLPPRDRLNSTEDPAPITAELAKHAKAQSVK